MFRRRRFNSLLRFLQARFKVSFKGISILLFENKIMVVYLCSLALNWFGFIGIKLIYVSLYLCSCKTCGQRCNDCPGHCGHIELVSTVFNPLLFDKLYNIIARTCFTCFRFRMDEEEVSPCDMNCLLL